MRKIKFFSENNFEFHFANKCELARTFSDSYHTSRNKWISFERGIGLPPPFSASQLYCLTKGANDVLNFIYLHQHVHKHNI